LTGYGSDVVFASGTHSGDQTKRKQRVGEEFLHDRCNALESFLFHNVDTKVKKQDQSMPRE
jgi:hypothetical protein